ncbi:MAG: transglycosylase SLT domain-containing protein [Ferruginibacter sp.]|nr:transglycosylase SLT domain-containing protein [Chitinophagaceae bacterium]
MIKQIYSALKVSKSIWIFFFIILLAASAKAGLSADTTKKRLLAATSAKDNAAYITLEPNVVFPEVLAGNEQETIAYIEKFSENRRAYLIRTFTRSKKYFPKVTTILKKHDLPQELKVLLALESAFNGNAVSKAGAVGYWQIMDEVAKEYGLKYVTQAKKEEKKKADKKKVDKTTPSAKTTAKKPAAPKDDRKNFNKSTYAAARYLKDRSRNLNNNLLLMVASYNCGIGNVWDAMKKSGKADPDFWDIKAYLPSETQAYVMNFITLNVVFHNYEKFTGNTLLFTPTRVKIENVAGKIAEETTSLND